MSFITKYFRGHRAFSIALLAVLAAAITTVAVASSSGPTPSPKPLDVAIHDAISGQPVPGVSADIKFTNSLVSSSALTQGRSSPLLTGASGRAWIAADGKFRLELQSDHGDAQIVSDGQTVTLYDASSNTVYSAALPQDTSKSTDTTTPDTHQPPTLADIQKAIAHLAESANVGGADPTNVGGQPAYAVSISPKHDGGLLGAVSLAFDAAKGVPLRIAVTAQGSNSPVLALEASNVSYGDVAASDLQVPNPPGAKHVTVNVPSQGSSKSTSKTPDVQGLAAVEAKVPFTLSAPDQLVGLPRKQVRLISGGDSPKALVVYGQGLGAIAVIEGQAKAADTAPAPAQGDHAHGIAALPTVAINGATAHELPTALGTLLTWDHNGVSYTLVGSLESKGAEAAATDLTK